MDQWQDIMASAELAPGDVVEGEWQGHDLLLFRTQSGECHIASGYCPHMQNYMPNGLPPGNPLSALLVEGQLGCPYHGWVFDEAGRCSRIPAGQKVPARITRGEPVLQTWSCREREGQIQILLARQDG